MKANYFLISYLGKQLEEKSKKKGSLLTMRFIVILALSILFVLSKADPLYTECSANINYTGHSEFESNLRLLLNDLSSNTSRDTSLGGFYNTSVGENPDIVHGQTLCRGDVNSTVCRNCIENAGDHLWNTCKGQDAMVWYEFCQVRYSFQILVPMQVFTGMLPESNKQHKFVEHSVLFEKVLMHLMHNLSNGAAFNASKHMFATGQIKFSDKETVYGLLQCTRDISGGECNNCFQSAFSELTECCSRRQGGIVVSKNCNVRFELYQFYNDSSTSLLSYPFPKGWSFKTFFFFLIN